jgi:hypothetical protein
LPPSTASVAPVTNPAWSEQSQTAAAATVGGLAGKRKLTAALKTYEAEVAGILGGVLRPEEQQMSDYFARLLTSIAQAEAT